MTSRTGDIMTLHVQFEDSELPDLRKLLLRALNTWDTAPQWAKDLDTQVRKKLATLQAEAILTQSQQYLEIKDASNDVRP